MKDAFPRWFWILAVLAGGAMLTGALPGALQAFTAPSVPVLWWAIRAFGLVAYLALWLSMVFGLLVSSHGAGGRLPGPWMMDLHRRWALAALVATGLHVLAVIGDPVSHIAPVAALVPFASARLTGPVALGTVAFFGLAAVAVTTAIPPKKLSRATWRAVHGLVFGVFLLALVHGITAGTDAGTPWVVVGYTVTVAVLLVGIAQRVVVAMRPARRVTSPRGAPRAARAASARGRAASAARR